MSILDFEGWVAKYGEQPKVYETPVPVRKVDLAEGHLRDEITAELTFTDIEFERIRDLLDELEWLHANRETY